MQDTRKLACAIRKNVLHMVHRANASHVGSCLSCIDILAVLYGQIMSRDMAEPDAVNQDHLILSKGHATAALYSTLAEMGVFPKAMLDEYGQDGTLLLGHASHYVPGVELSTGSLGHGLSVACGIALGLKLNDQPYRCFVLLSDGECDEGSIWEAALFAPHHQLSNLVVIVDFNKIQSYGSVEEVMGLEPFADKWRSFGWHVIELDGHDHDQLGEALQQPDGVLPQPTVVIAHTIKGKGVSFMENQLAWHYKSPSDEQLAQALSELEDHA